VTRQPLRIGLFALAALAWNDTARLTAIFIARTIFG